ncbi:MAG: PepSY domain-containing protein [Bacteriovoracaceae bacterium]
MLRKYHRIVSVIIAIPFAIILVTGLILQLRSQIEAVQPKAVKMTKLPGQALLTLEQIVEKSNKEPKEIEQIIYKPGKFHLAIRLADDNEMQMHPQTGEILKTAPRRSNFLIELHQGSVLGAFGQFGIMFPSSLALVFLLISGLLIFPWKKYR